MKGENMADSNIELELYLVRHGESKGNNGEYKDKSKAENADAPLSDKGVREAELLGEFFSECRLDAIFSSGLERSLRTGHEVALRQKDDGAKQVEVHGVFTECNTCDECAGRTIAEIKEKFPLMINAEGTDPDEKKISGKENDTDEQLLERGKQALKYIRDRFHNGEKVMVTSHAAINTFIMYAALGLSHEQIFDPSFYNTGVTKIVFYKKGTGAFADVHLAYQNDHSHLIGEFPEFKF